MNEEDIKMIDTALELDANSLYDVEHLSIQNMAEIHYSAAQQLYNQNEEELGDEHMDEALHYAQNLNQMLQNDDMEYQWRRAYQKIDNDY